MSTGSAVRTDRVAPAHHSSAGRVAMALVIAVAGNVVLAWGLADAVDAAPDFVGLQSGAVAAASAVGVLLGAAASTVLRRLGRQQLFVPLVVVGALLSLAGPLSLLGASPAEQPGVSDAAALALVPLHLFVAVVVAVVLPPGPSGVAARPDHPNR